MAEPKTLEQLQAEKEQAETQLARELRELECLENRKSISRKVSDKSVPTALQSGPHD